MAAFSSKESFPVDSVAQPVAPDSGASSRSAATELEDSHSGAFDDAYRVGWDGDYDPMSPRSMSAMHKWTIILVVCTATVCVYVSNTVSHFELSADIHL